MIANQQYGAAGRHSSRSAAHPAPYPYPSTRAAAQRMAAAHHHPGYATHQTASYYGQQQHEYAQRAAAGTIGGGYATGVAPAPSVAPEHPSASLPRLSFDRSTVHLPSYAAAPLQWAAPAQQQQQQQQTYAPAELDSSPFSEASDDFADAAGAGEFGYADEDESFEEGLVKDQYRGRGWDAGRLSSSSASSGAFENSHVIQQQQVYQAPAQQVYQQQPSGHLDRLFNGLQLPPLVPVQQQQQYYGHQQQQQMLPPLQQHVPAASPIPAPVQPATPTSALPLAPFVADAVWGMLQQTPAGTTNSKHKGEQQVQINGQWDDDRWSTDASYGYRTPPQFTLDDFATLPSFPAANPYRLAPHAPAGFARFINQTLAQTLISPTGVFLALWYIAHRMPLHEGGGEEGVMFRDELLSCARKFEGEAVARRVITLGLAWANKWLDDNTFTNRSWSDVTHIPIGEINRLELHALATMSFDLTISNDEYSAWLSLIYSSPAAKSSVLVSSHLVELADALSTAEAGRLAEAQASAARMRDIQEERERRLADERHERLLAAQAWEYSRQRQQQQQAAAAAAALYYPTSCARYSAGPAHIHQHGQLMPAACW